MTGSPVYVYMGVRWCVGRACVCEGGVTWLFVTRRTDDSELNSRCSEAPSRVRGNTNIDGRVTYHCICDCKASRVGACCRYGVTICGTENSYRVTICGTENSYSYIGFVQLPVC